MKNTTMLLDDDGGGDVGGGQQNISAENMLNESYIMSKRDPLYIVVPVTIIYSVIFVTGVIGNSITCMVIAKHKYMHTATNYYLFSLAVSDLILLVSGLPQEMWSIWSRYPYVFGEIFCQLRGLFSEMSANATVLTITAFTVERYVAICHPFMAQSMSKLSRAVKFIVIIWLVAVLFAIPQALQFTVISWNNSPEMVQCNIRNILLMYTEIQLSTVSFTLSTLLFFVLPMTVITVLYALIGLRLRRTDKLKRTVTVRSSNGVKKISSPEYRANSSSKVLKMLVAVVVAFFICWAPFHAQRLIAIFGSSFSSDLAKEDIPFLHQLYGISTYVSGVLYYMSTTINPILYHIMSLKFRTAFKETMLRCCGDRNKGRVQRCRRTGLRRRRGESPDADNRSQKYRRVSSGRTSLSVEFPDGVGGGVNGVGVNGGENGHDQDDGHCQRHDGHQQPQQQQGRRRRRQQRTPSPVSSYVAVVCGGNCWPLRRGGSGVGGGRAVAATMDGGRDERVAAARLCESTGSSTGSSVGGDGDGGGRGSTTTTPMDAATRRPALSDWTMISNSSLKDVDGDDLRDELVGYYAAAAVADHAVVDEYY